MPWAGGELRHLVDVLAGAGEEIATWFELGFGIDQIKGLRRTGSAGAGAPPGTRLRPAVVGDLGALIELGLELSTFHESPPILRRSVHPRERAVAELAAAVAAGDIAVFVAEASGRVVGFVEAEFDPTFESTATIFMAGTSASFRGRGMGSALVALVDAWALERDCDFLGVGWSSANLVSDRFWRRLGFRPARYRLARDFHDPPFGGEP